MTYPELQLLFAAEVPEDPCLHDFTISLAGNEYGILINDQRGRPSSQLTERTVDVPACFFGVVLVVLGVYDEIPAVSEEETDKMYPETF